MKAYIVEKELLAENIEKLVKHAGDVPVWGVLKGNGYGLGCVPMARILSAHGVDRFCGHGGGPSQDRYRHGPLRLPARAGGSGHPRL